MNLGLRGKAAVVSGSTAGIGLAIATALAAEGAKVVINGRTEARVAAALDKIHQRVASAELRGVDLTRTVEPDVFAKIERAFNRYGILVFPEQPVTDEQQLAFSRLFGPLEVNPNYAGARMRLRPDVADISNRERRSVLIGNNHLSRTAGRLCSA